MVFITIDALRADRLSCYGYHINTSPRLCSLADDGYQFMNAYSPASWTRLSLTSYMTGLYPVRTTAPSLRAGNPVREAQTIQRLLNNSGYYTIELEGSGALPYTPKRGWDVRWRREDATFTNIVDKKVDMALNHIDNGSRPFYLRTHIWGPHNPRYGDQEYNDSASPFSARFFSNITHRSRTAAYDTEVAYTDRHIGRLLDGLKRRGLYDNTLIIITADHGEGLGDHGYEGHGLTLYEEEVHVPLLVKPPHSSDSVRVAANTEVINVFYTMARFGGVNLSKLGYALDAAQLLDGEPEPVFTFTDLVGNIPDNYLYAGKSGNLKYIEANHSSAYYRSRNISLVSSDVTWNRTEFYNLSSDPHEQNRLLSTMPTEFQQLVDRIQSKYFGSPAREGYSEAIKEQLRRLGYIKDE